MVAWLLLPSCAYENEEELFGSKACQPEEITYSEVIQPIISSNCVRATCHDGSNPTAPDWTVLENIQARAPDIKQRTDDRTMPPSSSGLFLTAEQIGDIACWVDSGAPNN